MYKVNVTIKPGPDSVPRYLDLEFGLADKPNILRFDTQSAGHNKEKAFDWNAEGKEVVLAAVPAALVTDEKQRADLGIALDEEMPVLMELIRAEGDARLFSVILDDLEAIVQQLPTDSQALATVPRVMAEIKAIQFRDAQSPEIEHPQYPRPLSIGMFYTEMHGQLATVDLLALDPKITPDSIFEILLDFDEADGPKYDYAILLQQLAGFVDDHYNTYNKPGMKLLGLLMQYGLVSPDTTLEAFIAKGLEDAKAQSTAESEPQ